MFIEVLSPHFFLHFFEFVHVLFPSWTFLFDGVAQTFEVTFRPSGESVVGVKESRKESRIRRWQSVSKYSVCVLEALEMPRRIDRTLICNAVLYHFNVTVFCGLSTRPFIPLAFLLLSHPFGSNSSLFVVQQLSCRTIFPTRTTSTTMDSPARFPKQTPRRHLFDSEHLLQLISCETISLNQSSRFRIFTSYTNLIYHQFDSISRQNVLETYIVVNLSSSSRDDDCKQRNETDDRCSEEEEEVKKGEHNIFSISRMRDSRSLSFSLSLSLRAFYFKKLSRCVFQKNFLSFIPHTTTSGFVLVSTSRRARTHYHTHKKRTEREDDGRCARFTFFSFSAARLFLSRVSLSFSLSGHFFEYLIVLFFP